MIRANLLEDSLNLNMTGSHTNEVRLVLNALAAGSSDALCPCQRFSRTREPFATANGYGMKHDKANILNPTTEASPVCNSLQLCIETPHGSKVFVHGLVPRFKGPTSSIHLSLASSE